jgi:hypothetical protein
MGVAQIHARLHDLALERTISARKHTQACRTHAIFSPICAIAARRCTISCGQSPACSVRNREEIVPLRVQIVHLRVRFVRLRFTVA